MKAENAFMEFETDVEASFPEIYELNIVSGGCHLYGYLLTPDKRIAKPYPTIIMSHGFPGYTTNNDLELAFMRMGCVVIHMNHRGAWGSEGNYLFTNLKEDLIAIAKWAHNPAIADQYGIDVNNIFLQVNVLPVALNYTNQKQPDPYKCMNFGLCHSHNNRNRCVIHTYLLNGGKTAW